MGMKVQWAVPIIASILILGTLGLTQNASAAQGTITEVNPSGKHGMITEDGCEGTKGKCQYQFQIPKGVASGYEPSVGDVVTFTVGNGQKATEVTLVDDPPVGDLSIDPTSGPIGTAFTITDPDGRFVAGDIVVFTSLGTDPTTNGINADNVSVSADGTTVTGNVPVSINLGIFAVTVHDDVANPDRLGIAFLFTVTS